MGLNINSILVILGSVWGWIVSKRELWTKLVKIVTPLVAAAEEMALDGVIDLADRKKLVMLAISECEKDGTIKLNWLTRWLISKVVDKVAKNLPDFKVGKNIQEVMFIAKDKLITEKA